VRYVLKKAGLKIPNYIGIDDSVRPIRHADEIWDRYGIYIHPDTYQAGDLIVFSYNKGLSPTHIGIVRDEESYIHAPGKEGTQVTIATIAHKAIEQSGILRALYSFNPIGFKSPVIPLKEPTPRYHQMPV